MNSLGGVVRFGEGGVGQRLPSPALIPSFSPLCLAPSPYPHLSLKMILSPPSSWPLP